MDLKEQYKRTFQSVTPAPQLNAHIERKVLEEMQRRNHVKTVRRTALLAIALVLTMFTAVAFATGWAQSIFAGLSDLGHDEGKDFQAMEKMAQNQVGKNQIAFVQDASVLDFEVSQAYYDGTQLMLGTVWGGNSSAVDLSFGPGSPHFEDLKPLEANADMASLSPRNRVSPEAWAEFEKLYQKNGAAGMVYYDMYPGDGVNLGDTYLSPHLADGGTLDDGRTWAYIEFETPLPQEAQQQENLMLTMILYKTPVYYYQKGDKPEDCLRCFGEREELKFHFSVANNHAPSRVLTEKASFDQYSVDTEITLTAIRAKAKLSMTTSEKWKEAMVKDDYGEQLVSGVDYILEYNVYVDGVQQSRWVERGGADGFDGSFKVSSDAAQIIFRPVYSLTGEHPEEDITFTLK